MIVFYGEILSFVLLIGYEQYQYEFCPLWFSWINLSTYEINLVLQPSSELGKVWRAWALEPTEKNNIKYKGPLDKEEFHPEIRLWKVWTQESFQKYVEFDRPGERSLE